LLVVFAVQLSCDGYFVIVFDFALAVVYAV